MALQIKAVIFDRDGVLTYFDVVSAVAFFQPLLPISLEEIARRWVKRGKEIGFPRSLGEEVVFFREFWAAISAELGLSDEICSQLQRFEYTSCMLPFLDARPALLEVRQRKLGIGVLSNFSLASLDGSLAAVDLAELVDVACAATVIGAAKPDAKAYLTITQLLGVQPEECLFFDDEIVCVEGGRAVGMQAYLVDRQSTKHDITKGIVCDLTAVAQILG